MFVFLYWIGILIEALKQHAKKGMEVNIVVSSNDMRSNKICFMFYLLEKGKISNWNMTATKIQKSDKISNHPIYIKLYLALIQSESDTFMIYQLLSLMQYR